MLVDKILEYYTQFEKDREWANPLRMSNAGKCARAIAYQLHGYEAEPLSSRARMTFRLGDLIEQDMVAAALKCSDFTGMQDEVEISIENTSIKGHIDGYLPATEDHLETGVDFKSISDFGFKRAQSGEVDYSYICQANCYMAAKSWKQFLIVFYKKHTSHLTEVFLEFNPAIWGEIVARFTSVIKSTKELLPTREHEADEKGKLPWQCSYCQYCKICWPEYKLSFDKNNKPQLAKETK